MFGFSFPRITINFQVSVVAMTTGWSLIVLVCFGSSKYFMVWTTYNISRDGRIDGWWTTRTDGWTDDDGWLDKLNFTRSGFCVFCLFCLFIIISCFSEVRALLCCTTIWKTDSWIYHYHSIQFVYTWIDRYSINALAVHVVGSTWFLQSERGNHFSFHCCPLAWG